MCGNYSSPNSENNFCSKECEIFDSLEFEDENFHDNLLLTLHKELNKNNID